MIPAVETIRSRGHKGDIFHLAEKSIAIDLVGGVAAAASARQRSGFGVRVFVNDRVGFAATTRPDHLGRAVDAAIAAAPFGERVPIRLPATAPEGGATASSPSLSELDASDLAQMGRDLFARIQSRVRNAHVTATIGRQEQSTDIVNTEGLQAHHRRAELTVSWTAVRATENDILTWFCNLRFSERPDPVRLEPHIDRFAEEMRQAERVVPTPTGPTRVLIEPEAMPFLIHALTGGLSARAVLERRSPLADRLGEPILDPQITLTDDVRGEGLAPFDDEGVEVRREPFVENGVLRAYATDLRHAALLDLPPTGSGLRQASILSGRAFDQPVGIGFAFPRLEGGTIPEESALQTLGDGVIIRFSYDAIMGNAINGDLTGTILLGYRVEGGEITGRVKGAAFSGNIYRWLGDQLIGLSARTRQTRSTGGGSYPRVLVDGVELTG